MIANRTWPWVLALTTGSALAAGAREDIDARCSRIGDFLASPFGESYGEGRIRGAAAGLKAASQGSLDGQDIDALGQSALRVDLASGLLPVAQRSDYARGFADGFVVGLCNSRASARPSRVQRVWDPALGRYREEKPGQVWDPSLGRYRVEKPGQVWDPGLGRYRDRDPQRDGPAPTPSPNTVPGRHRHADVQGWCTERH